jgi:hypothetical protein
VAPLLCSAGVRCCCEVLLLCPAVALAPGVAASPRTFSYSPGTPCLCLRATIHPPSPLPTPSSADSGGGCEGGGGRCGAGHPGSGGPVSAAAGGGAGRRRRLPAGGEWPPRLGLAGSRMHSGAGDMPGLQHFRQQEWMCAPQPSVSS